MRSGRKNRDVWNRIYSSGDGIMEYPSENLVRLVHRRLDPEVDRNVLDLGFGSGNNLIFLLRAGFQCSGVEISPEATRIAGDRLRKLGLTADLRTMEHAIPFDDGSFDAVISWHVLYYNGEEELAHVLNEAHRVLLPQGKLLATLIRHGDLSLRSARPLGTHTYVVGTEVPSQRGAVVFVPEGVEHIRSLFARYENVEIGHMEWSFDSVTGSHWIIWAEKGTDE